MITFSTLKNLNPLREGCMDWLRSAFRPEISAICLCRQQAAGSRAIPPLVLSRFGVAG
jgi:hypothetical protein